MPTLNIQGQRVKVDDSFMSLSPDDQNKTVEEISGQLKIAPPSPSAAPAEATQQPAQPVSTAEPSNEADFQRMSILPLSKNVKTGDVELAVPGFVKGIADAFTAPGRAMSGELQVTDQAGNVTPEAIGEGINFASMFAGSAPGTAVASAVPKAAAEQVVKPGMEAAAAASRLGVDLPRAAASDSIAVQQTGKILTNVPVGGTPLRAASTKAIEQLGDAANRVQQGYGSGDVASAGAAMRQGVTKYGTETLPEQVSDAYKAVDGLVDHNIKTPLSATQQKAAEIIERRKNATLGEGQAAPIVKAATAPTPAPTLPANPIGFTAKIPDGAPVPGEPVPNPGLNYEGVKDLRTNIGEMIKDPRIAPQGTSQAELKQIYGSLTDDLGAATENAGGAAATQAWKDANSLAKSTAAEREALDRLVAPQSDEGLFSKLHAMAGSTSSADLAQLARARKAVGPETWNEVASGVISKMGRDADGNFSPDRFVTAYGKLSQNGKNLLFRGNGKDDLASSLEDIATVSRRFKQLNQYANPSGTGQAVIGGSYLPMLWTEPTTLISSVVSARALSSLLAKPVGAKAIAAYSKAYEAAATAPNAATSKALLNTARAVSSIAANESGNKDLAGQLFPRLSSPVPAGQ